MGTAESLRFQKFDFAVPSLSQLEMTPGTVSKGVWYLGSDATGISDAIPVIAVRGRTDGPTVWIQGSIHGDEPSSTWVVSSLAKMIDPDSLNGTVLLLPVLNISAFRVRQTQTPIDNTELYRAFPGQPKGSYTYQVAHAIEKDFLQLANCLIDVHAGTSIHRVVEFTSYPGGLEASSESEKIALATASPIVVRRNVQTPSEKNIMFMFACSKGVPSIMISSGGHRRVESQFVDPLINQCLNVLRHLGMIPGEKLTGGKVYHLEGIFYDFCTQGGFVFYEKTIGEWVKKDQVLCRFYDVYGNEAEVIRCPYEEALLIETASGVLNAGELVAEYFVPMS